MGDSYEAAGANSPIGTFAQFLNLMPTSSAIAGNSILPLAAQQSQASNLISQTNNQANVHNLLNYIPALNQIGQYIENSNALAGAGTTARTLQGPGADAARAGSALTHELNPNYFTAQNPTSQGASDLIKSISLTGLSPGEAAATERGVNQYNQSTGNAALSNPTKVLSDAINFGGAFNQKQGIMANAVNTGANAANSAMGNAGFNPVATALTQPNPQTMSNFGTGQFVQTNPSTAAGPSNNVFNWGQSIYGSLAGNNASAQNAGASMANATSPAAYLGSL